MEAGYSQGIFMIALIDRTDLRGPPEHNNKQLVPYRPLMPVIDELDGTHSTC